MVLDGGVTCSHATLTTNDCAWNSTRARGFTIVVVARLDGPLPGTPPAPLSPPPSSSPGGAGASAPGQAWKDPVAGPVLATLSHYEGGTAWDTPKHMGQLALTPSVFMRESGWK